MQISRKKKSIFYLVSLQNIISKISRKKRHRYIWSENREWIPYIFNDNNKNTLFKTPFFNERQSPIVRIREAQPRKQTKYVWCHQNGFLLNFKSPKSFLSSIPINYSHLVLLLKLLLHATCCLSMHCKLWVWRAGLNFLFSPRIHTSCWYSSLDFSSVVLHLPVGFFVVSCLSLQRKQVSVSIN